MKNPKVLAIILIAAIVIGALAWLGVEFSQFTADIKEYGPDFGEFFRRLKLLVG